MVVCGHLDAVCESSVFQHQLRNTVHLGSDGDGDGYGDGDGDSDDLGSVVHEVG
jgi:hypothetical protein